MIKNFFRFLYWFWYDWRHPLPKRPYGITCYVGLEGYGKTLSLSEKLMRLKFQYPKAIIGTNFGWNFEDFAVESWRDLLNIDNGEDGVIFGLDEISSIWDRYEAGKIPTEILEMFRQNRKYAKQMIGTAQSFADIVIDVRRRCREIIECNNIRNRWIFQRAFHPDDYKEKDGEFKPRHRLYRYNFIASNIIYDSYNTYKRIEALRKELKTDLKPNLNPA